MIRAFQLFWESIGDTPKTATYTRSRFTHILDSTKKAESFFRKMWNKELLTIQEEVYVIFVDNDNRIIEWMLLHKGGTRKCFIDIQLLYKFAYKFDASGIFIAHNHPKGSIKTSPEDDNITLEIKVIADKLGFRFLDHIIITSKKYYSYYESGMLD